MVELLMLLMLVQRMTAASRLLVLLLFCSRRFLVAAQSWTLKLGVLSRILDGKIIVQLLLEYWVPLTVIHVNLLFD